MDSLRFATAAELPNLSLWQFIMSKGKVSTKKQSADETRSFPKGGLWIESGAWGAIPLSVEDAVLFWNFNIHGENADSGERL